MTGIVDYLEIGKDSSEVTYAEEVKSSHSDTIGLGFVFLLGNKGVGVVFPCEYLGEV
jgi:hypothetical protein